MTSGGHERPRAGRMGSIGAIAHGLSAVDLDVGPGVTSGAMSDLCFLTAVELAERIRRRDVSVTEVVRAHLAQIERVNPKVNAIVTLTAERALDDARDKDARLARGERPGPLFGLPIAHKDLVPTRGIRTTWGSPIYRDHVPTSDGLSSSG